MKRLYSLLLALVVLLGICASVAMAGHNGSSLVARYPFDTLVDNGEERDRTPDVSGHGLDLFGEGFLFPGRFGQAMFFSGSQTGSGLEAGRNALFEPPDSAGLSVHGWVYFRPDNEGGAQTPGPNKAIVAKGGRNCRQPSYGLSTGENEGLEFAVDMQRSDSIGNVVVRTPPIPPGQIWDGDFHPVTGVYGATTEDGTRSVKLWVDGKLVGAQEIPEDATRIDHFNNHVVDQQLTVGRIIQDSCTENRTFPGGVDDLRIYGEALSRRQIRYLHEKDRTEPPDLDIPPPPGFADWTSVEPGKVSGTLLGSSISLSGTGVDPNSYLDGFDDRFNRPAFTPGLTRSDAPGFFGSTGNTYTLRFGAPVRDPVIHLGSLSSTLQFPPGTSITKVSGEDDFTVSGSSVSGVGEGGFESYSSGTVRLNGQFSEIPFSTTYPGAEPDPIFFQVGRPRLSAPVNVIRPQVSGTPSPGSTLSCTQGEWNGSSAGLLYTYTWERAPRATRFEDDQAWGPIDGASGSNKTQYTVQDVDLGSRVRCRVTRSDEGGVDDAASRSLRVDTGAPVNVTPPSLTGSAQTLFGRLTCEPGEWQNGPDFAYQWIRDGATAIPGATKKTYTPSHRRDPNNPNAVSNPNGDGNHRISCRVTASNDIGLAAPLTSASVLAYDNVPLNSRPPRATLATIPRGENAVGRKASCSTGDWIDGYGQYRYQWFRGFQSGEDETSGFEPGSENSAKISGATGPEYEITVADLGRFLFCKVSDSNPLGEGRPKGSSNLVQVPLPTGTVDSEIYKAGGRNAADPTNLLAISNEYAREVDKLVVERLNDAIDAEVRDCRKLGIPGSAPPPESVKSSTPITNELRCRMVLYARERVKVLPQGARYDNGKCAVDHRFSSDYALGLKACPDLRFQVPAIDPKRPPKTDTGLLERLKPLTPEVILWDLDRNGVTDAACPGSAPVLRTILPNGGWRPRAVIVKADSAATGQFSIGETGFRSPVTDTTTKTAGYPRPGQVKVCATAFDPPPDPEQKPCVTHGEIGRVMVDGNLCPIDLRQIEGNDFENLDGDLKRLLVAQSEERLKKEGVQTSSKKDEMESTEPVWLPTDEPRDSGVFARISQNQNTLANGISATYTNTAASLTSFGTGGQPKAISAKLKKKLKKIESINLPKAGFALDQIYLSRAETMRMNGVVIDPLGTTGALLVPSDVKGALTNVKDMTVNARNAATYLGSKASGIPLATEGTLKAELNDRVAGAGKSLIRETNLDQLVEKLQGAADKLKLGPFKLRGTAQVKLADDGTATLEAKAILPGLDLGPGGAGEIRADVKLKGDLQGRVKLQGIRVRTPYAYLGPVKLQDLDLTYDNGIDLKGKILFPPPVAQGIGINRFKLGPEGQFQILDVDYLAGAGSGIPVGPGVFITRLGGGLNLLNSTVKGRTTVSVGPAAAEGGCPTVGIAAEFEVHFAELFYLDAKGTVQLVCIDLVDIKFHADASGLVTLDAIIDKSLGPLFFKVQLGAALRLPNWQVTASGAGGVRGIPLIGTIEAQIKIALSNIGLAGCGRVKIPVLPDIAAGAAVRFSGGRPPFTIGELIANLRFFTGCDISAYYSVVQRAVARGAQAGSNTFSIPKGAGPTLLSIEGAGGAPRVRLRAPSGQVLDYTDATGDDGKTVGPGLGTVIEEEDRTVVLLGRAEAGTWTAEVAEGSPAVTRVRLADILPKAKVTGKVTGKGSKRTLAYDVKPLKGQSVRLVEVAKGGQKILRTVKGGGRGRIGFTVTEAQGTKRSIVAEVIQDDLPRTNLTIARFTAASPRVGRPRNLRMRRRGSRATVTWSPASFGSSFYEVSVRYGVGRTVLLTPKRGTRRVVVPRVLKKEGLTVSVVGFSPAGHRGPAATGKLKGSMQVGAVPKAKARGKPRSRPKR